MSVIMYNNIDVISNIYWLYKLKYISTQKKYIKIIFLNKFLCNLLQTRIYNSNSE